MELMERNQHLTAWVIAALLIGIVFTVLVMPSKTVPVASVCATPQLSCPDPNITVPDTETAWKDTAVGLANAEWGYNGYKALFLELNNIDRKQDISSVSVVSSSFKSSDSYSEDAVLTQRLKVYYEDSDGDSVKDYLTVKTTIENSEVIDQTIN